MHTILVAADDGNIRELVCLFLLSRTRFFLI